MYFTFLITSKQDILNDIGISASLVIYPIVNYEFGFENFQKDKDRIYRIMLKADIPGRKINYAGSPSPMGAAIKNEVTGIIVFQRYHPNDWNSVTLPGIQTLQAAWADPVKSINLQL